MCATGTVALAGRQCDRRIELAEATFQFGDGFRFDELAADGTADRIAGEIPRNVLPDREHRVVRSLMFGEQARVFRNRRGDGADVWLLRRRGTAERGIEIGEEPRPSQTRASYDD